MTVAITYPVDALVSYHYYRDDRNMAALVKTGRLRLIGDSGAFSALTQGAHIDLSEYASWVTRWRPHLFWPASLDVIGDASGTFKNWEALRDRHALATLPTLHAGADTKWLDIYASEGVDFIGLGGMAGTGQAPRAFRWAVHMMRYARDHHPGVRFHLWGVTRRQFLDVLPAFSADSSGILGQAYRYASLRLFDPATGKHHSANIGKGSREVYRLAPLLRRTYGVSPEDVAPSRPDNRATLIQLAAASTQQYAAWLQRRHRVAAPSWAINPCAPASGTGPVLHAAETNNKDLLATGPVLHATGGADKDLDGLVGARIHMVDASHTNLADTVK